MKRKMVVILLLGFILVPFSALASNFTWGDLTEIQKGGWYWPVPEYYNLSRGFNYYIGGDKRHGGIDIDASLGKEVKAAKAGTVVIVYYGCNNVNGNKKSCRSKNLCNPYIITQSNTNGEKNNKYYNDCCNSGYGNGIVIKNIDGTYSYYAHMQNNIVVSVNQQVAQGALLGYVGSSGNSTGSHLHFGIGLNESASICCDSNPNSPSFGLTVDGNNNGNSHWSADQLPVLYDTKGVTYSKELNGILILNIENGTIAGATSGAVITKGTTITLTAQPNDNYEFTGWLITGVNNVDVTANPLTFTMPSTSVTVTAKIKLKTGALVKSWSGTVLPARTNAVINGELTVDASSITLLGSTITVPHTIKEVYLVISEQESIASLLNDLVSGLSFSAVYKKQFSVPTPTVTNINGGKRSVYSFSVSSMSELKNGNGQSLMMSPGTTYYFYWICKVNDENCRMDNTEFTTAAGSARWDEHPENYISNDRFCNYVYYYNNQITLSEVGIFVSADESAVLAAKYNNYANNVENLKDTSNIDYQSSYSGTKVFYRFTSFNKISFDPGVTYYYKFYSRDTDGEIVYSNISSCMPGGSAIQYGLTVGAGSGGMVAAGASGNYAAGNVIKLYSTPYTGYCFSGWTATSGTLEDASSSVTNFIMPASDATVTASFEKEYYVLDISPANAEGGSVNAALACYAYGAQIPISAVPYEGYRFVGWQSDNGGTFADSAEQDTVFTMPAGPVHLYAYFEQKEYRIDTTILGGQGSVLCNTTSARCGERITLTAQPSEKYEFVSWSCADAEIDDPQAETVLLTMPAHDITVNALFGMIRGTATTEWQYASYLPMNLDPEALDIEYCNHYSTISASSPGVDWVQGPEYRCYYQNNGTVQEYLTQQTASDTFVYLGYYYFHYCGADVGVWVNYERTTKYNTYHYTECVEAYDVINTYFDDEGNCYSYKLKWNSGQWAGGQALCEDQHSSIWYRKYKYQPRIRITEYNWSKDSDWVAAPDSLADSYHVRWRLKGGNPLPVENLTEIIAVDSLTIVAGETVHLDLDTVPKSVDLSALVYVIENEALMEMDDDWNITAKYAEGIQSTNLTISAPNGVSKTVVLNWETNITGCNVTVNDLSANGTDTVDIFSMGQSIPYSVNYHLSNNYNPGYPVTFNTDPADFVTQNNGVLQFVRTGVFELSIETLCNTIQFGTILVTDPALSMTLPQMLVEIEEEAFDGIQARTFYLPSGINSIGANAFPSGSVVFLNTFNIEEMAVDTGAALYVETSNQYNEDFLTHIPNADLYIAPRGIQMGSKTTQYRYRTKQTTTSSQNSLSGWTLYDEQPDAWSAWISNGTTPVTASTDLDVNTIYHPEQTAVTGYNYHRFRYIRSSDGAVMYTYSENYALSQGGYRQNNSVTAANRLPTYNVYDGYQSYGVKGNFWFYEEPVTGVITAGYTEYQYRTRTRTYYFYRWTDWSDWQDEPVTENESTEVETREI